MRPSSSAHVEALLVGAVLIDPHRMADVVHVTPAMFADADLGRVFEAVRRRWSDHREVSAVLVAEDVGADEALRRRLVEVVAACDRPSAAAEAADLVVDAWHRRRAVELSSRLSRAAVDGGDWMRDVRELGALVDSTLEAGQLARRVLSGTQIERMTPPQWLVPQWLAHPSLAVLYGEPGTGKSVLAQALALALATGKEWLGMEVVGTRTLYVVAEGVAGMGRRNAAWRDFHGVSEQQCAGVMWLPEPVDLTDRTKAEELAVLADQLGVGMVVIDTLARCMPGADENSTADMGLVVAHLDLIRGTNRLVLVVHHVGKDRTKGMRGSTALLGAADTTIELIGRRGDKEMLIRVDKQKDASPPDPIRFRLLSVASSVVPVRHDVGIVPDLMGRQAAEVMMLLVELSAVVDGAWTPIPNSVLRAAWTERTNASESSYYRALKAAVEAGLIAKVGRSGYVPGMPVPPEEVGGGAG